MSRAFVLVIASACLVACQKPRDPADPAPTPSEAPSEASASPNDDAKAKAEAPPPDEPAEGIQVGLRAPDFEVKDEAGNTVKLSQHRGKQAVLLAFYPKDFTGG